MAHRTLRFHEQYRADQVQTDLAGRLARVKAERVRSRLTVSTLDSAAVGMIFTNMAKDDLDVLFAALDILKPVLEGTHKIVPVGTVTVKTANFVNNSNAMMADPARGNITALHNGIRWRDIDGDFQPTRAAVRAACRDQAAEEAAGCAMTVIVPPFIPAPTFPLLARTNRRPVPPSKRVTRETAWTMPDGSIGLQVVYEERHG